MSLIARDGRLNSPFYSLTLPVAMGSKRYNFVRWSLPRLPSKAASRSLTDQCEDLDAVLFVVDLDTSNTCSADGSVVEEWDDILLHFRRTCKFPWLAKKDIILILLNVKKLSCRSPDVQPSGPAHRDSHVRTADYIKNRFASLNEGKSREIHVIFAENEIHAKNLEIFQKIVKQILSKKSTAAGDLGNV